MRFSLAEGGTKKIKRLFGVRMTEGSLSMEKIRQLPVLLLLAGCLVLVACGYAVQKSPIESVRIGKIENRTFEPRLEDHLSEALASALLRNGIDIDGRSPYTVEGTIDTFELRSLSEKEGVAIRYEVIIKGRFYLVDSEGATRELRNRGVFIVSFPSEEALGTVLALKEEAAIRALEDMSEEIAASIIYGR